MNPQIPKNTRLLNSAYTSHKKNILSYYTFIFAQEGDSSDSKVNSKTPWDSFTHSLIYAFIYSFIYSFIQSCIHSFFSWHFIDLQFITLFTGNALCTHPQQHSKKPPQRLGGISENKSDIILIENIAFNYLLINYFSIGHQVSPLKPLLD